MAKVQRFLTRSESVSQPRYRLSALYRPLAPAVISLGDGCREWCCSKARGDCREKDIVGNRLPSTDVFGIGPSWGVNRYGRQSGGSQHYPVNKDTPLAPGNGEGMLGISSTVKVISSTFVLSCRHARRGRGSPSLSVRFLLFEWVGEQAGWKDRCVAYMNSHTRGHCLL